MVCIMKVIILGKQRRATTGNLIYFIIQIKDKSPKMSRRILLMTDNYNRYINMRWHTVIYYEYQLFFRFSKQNLPDIRQ